MARLAIGQELSTHPLFRVGLFTAAYMSLACWMAVRVRNAEFAFYIAVMFVLIACVAWIYGRVSLTPGLLWALSIWGALHMAGGLVSVPESWPTDGGFRVLYSWWIIPSAAGPGGAGGWLKYDQATHAYGFGVATWLCWQGLCGAVAGSASPGRPPAPLKPTAGLMVLVAAAGMGLGALNEVVEFIATRITVTNVGGYVNTGLDLVFNALGATGAAALIYVTASRGGPGPG
jgi:hypothetical protein